VAKKVVVIASGETERRALPHLVRHLHEEGIEVVEIRIPPRGALNVEMAEKLIKAAWFQQLADPPDKFVLLVDVDGKDPDEVLRPFHEKLPLRLGSGIGPLVLYAFAQWHLEAWYFADQMNLRGYLKRPLGNVGSYKPDEIQNPKLHLKHLLGNRMYTAVVSEEISRTLVPNTIAQRSPSFYGFLEAIRNGDRVAR
jgi:hypothetical protein